MKSVFLNILRSFQAVTSGHRNESGVMARWWASYSPNPRNDSLCPRRLRYSPFVPPSTDHSPCGAARLSAPAEPRFLPANLVIGLPAHAEPQPLCLGISPCRPRELPCADDQTDGSLLCLEPHFSRGCVRSSWTCVYWISQIQNFPNLLLMKVGAVLGAKKSSRIPWRVQPFIQFFRTWGSSLCISTLYHFAAKDRHARCTFRRWRYPT